MSKTEVVFGKSEIVFTFLRYFSYALQTARGFILAYFLGPYFLGIYGYIILYQQYLSYSNVGIIYSVNSELSLLSLEQEIEKKKIIDSAFSGIIFVSIGLVFIALLLFYFKVQLFPFKDSHKYIFVLVILTVLTHFQQIFVNIFRITKKLKPIIVGELIISSGLLTLVFFFQGINLVNAIFYGWSGLLLIVVTFYYKIYGQKIVLDTSRVGLLLKSGFPLLIYAFSYYLMGLLVRTLIGAFYPVNVMGYFSFANNITTAIMLGLDTITWIIFPSIIAKLAEGKLNKDELTSYVVSFTSKLLILVTVIVTLSIISLPILFVLLPKYKPVEYSLIVLLINQIIFNSGFAFVSLFIARKMYVHMAIISLCSVAISGILSAIFCFYDLPYIWLVVSNVIGSLCFINILIYFTSRKLNLKSSHLRNSFPWILQAIFILIIVSAVFMSYWLILVLLIVIMLIKFKSINELYGQLVKVLIKES